MRKVLAIYGLLLAMLVAVVLTERPAPPADLTVIHVADFSTLDPQRMSYNQDLRLCYTIYEGLVRWNNRTFEIEPAIARDWEISEDGRTYTFFLTDRARWSDGEPVTARDFAYSWRRALQPELAKDYSGLFFRIKGAEDYFNWRADQLAGYASRPASERTREAARALLAEADAVFAEMVGIEVVDDYTLRITLERPKPYFLDLCAFGPFYPVSERALEAVTPSGRKTWVDVDPLSGAIRQKHGWTKPEHIVVNGPYIPVDWRYKRGMRLERNPHYWQPERGKSDSIRIIPIEDPSNAVLTFMTGGADWHSDVTVDYVADMLERKADGDMDEIHAFSTFGTYFWSFNCTPTLPGGRPNPFHDPRVRRAFALAVDKQEIIDNVKRSGEKRASVFVPPGSIPGFASPEGLGHDVLRAKEEFAAAGWADRDGDGVPENEQGTPFPTIEMLCTPGGYHDDVALAMGAMWQEVFGVRTKVVVKETKVYKDEIKRHDFFMARGGWYGDYGDPTTFLDLHKTGDGNNDRGYSDPHLDGLLARADDEPDPGKRLRILEEAERYTMEESLPILPIWHYNYYYMFEPGEGADGEPIPGGVRGITGHPRLVQYLWQLEVVR